MSTIIQTESGLFVHHRGRIDYTWIVKPIKLNKRYGTININTIFLPNKFVGKRFRIKLEEVKKCQKK